METNNLDIIKQALLYTKQNNLVYKKVYASGPAPYPYLAIKVISKDPDTINFSTEQQDKDYYVTTFLTDGSENWNTWRDELTNPKKGWWILSATETKQRGTKNTSMIPKNVDYLFQTEFLDTRVSRDNPGIRPLGFLENAAVPATGMGHNILDRGIIGLSNFKIPLPGLSTPKYEAVTGLGSTFYKGVKAESDGTLSRNYSASNASTNMIQNYFLTLGDDQKIIIGWSGGPFSDWWEDKYTMSAVKGTGEMDNYAAEDNPEAVATFNQVVPMKADYSTPNYRDFYFNKKREFDNNPDPKKGIFKIPLPTEDEVIFYDLDLKTFYELGIEPKLTSKEVDSDIVNGLINKLMGQIKNDQPIDEINKQREEALKDELDRGGKAQRSLDTGANILTNLFKKVDK